MKFIHAADIHLGCQPDRGFPWSRERSFDILAAFRDLIDACRTERADLLLLSGDIFHRQPAPAELKEAEALFSNIPQTPIVMISGNHDPVRPGSALAEYAWPSHVSFLSSRELSSVSFPDLKTVVHGFSYHTREIREPLYDSLTAPGDGNFHILLAHGGDASHIPIDREKLARSGFSYIALGHIHKPELDPDHRLAFAGSLSPIDLTETGSHGYIVGELEENGESGDLALRFVPLPSRSYIPCAVKVTPRTTHQSLYQTVKKFIEQHGVSNIYRLTLTGQRDPDITFDQTYLSDAGRIISYKDETVPAYDLPALYRDHRRDIIGAFIDAFSKGEAGQSENDSVRSQAFYYGLDALLSNFDSDTGESQ
mgnify:FL=1